jgi:hypothetical protein
VRASVLAILLAACSSPAKSPVTSPPPPTTTTTTPPTATDPAWFAVAHGALADVAIERAVYDSGDPARFFVRVQVANRTDRPIYVDLRDYWRTIYPNQWEASPIDHRQGVDEIRVTHKPVDAAALRAATAQLTAIPAHTSLDVYRDFNGGGRAKVESQPGAYLLIAIDGQLAITDGTAVDDLWIGEDEAARILVIREPLDWRPVPAGALTLKDW